MRNGMETNERVVCIKIKQNLKHESDRQELLLLGFLKMMAACRGIHSFPNKKVKKK